ncbi:MAG: CBS domain-containing protein [Myxococcota bacterium]
MNVSSILHRKGTQVVYAGPDLPLLDAAQRLADEGVGSLVVLDESRELLGVLSERDLVRALTKHGRGAPGVPIVEALHRQPVVCHPEDPLRAVLSIMTQQRTRHLPVYAGEALVGLISIGDVVKGLLEELEMEVGVLRDVARAKRR